MTAKTNRFNWPATILLALFAGYVGYSSQANRAPTAPAVIATVDLERVFQGLDERKAADDRLTKLAGELDRKGQEKRKEVNLLSEDLELFAPGTPQFQQTSAELAEKGYRLKAYLDFAVRKLDAAKSRTLHELYEDRIKPVVAEIAQENGYDLVVVDDSIVGLPTDASESEMMRQISARRLLWSNPLMDITDDIIARMN